MATTDYNQTNTAAAGGHENAFCTGGSTQPSQVNKQAEVGATIGSTEATTSIGTNRTTLAAFFEVILPTDVESPTDTTDASIPINFTTGDMDLTLDAVYICRLNSSYVNQETIGSATSIGHNTNDGSTTVTVTGMSSVTFSAGDIVAVALMINNANTMFARSFGITPDQTMALPFNSPAGVSTFPQQTLSQLGVGI